MPDSKGIDENDSAAQKKSCYPVLQDRCATPFCDQNYSSYCCKATLIMI